MHRLQKYLWIVILLSCGQLLGQRFIADGDAATEECYLPFYQASLAHYYNQEFARAMEQLRLALSVCEEQPAIIDSMILEVTKAENNHLKRQEQEFQFLQAQVEKFARREEQALARLRNANKLAEQNQNAALVARQEAIQKGRKATAYRLSNLAEIERRKNKLAKALYLALLAIDYSDDETLPLAKRTFSDIVRDSMAIPFFMPNQHLRQLQLSDGKMYTLADDQLRIIDDFQRPETSVTYSGIKKILATFQGGWAATTNQRGEVIINQGKEQELVRLIGHNDEVKTLLELDQGGYVSGSRDNKIIHWDKVGNILGTFSGHQESVYSLVDDVQQGSLLSRAADGKVILWNVKETSAQFTLSNDGNYIYDFTSSNNLVFIGDASGALSIFSKKDGSLVKQIMFQGAVVEVLAHPQNPDKVFVRGRGDNKMLLYDCLSGNEIYIEHAGVVNGITFAPISGEVFSWTENGGLKISDSEGQVLRKIDLKLKPLAGIIFLPQKKGLITYYTDGNIQLWNSNYELFADFESGCSANLPPLYDERENRIIYIGLQKQNIYFFEHPDLIFDRISRTSWRASLLAGQVEKDYVVLDWQSL